MILIGYSGHGYVACSVAQAAGTPFTAYCDKEQKIYNPFHLQYAGEENSEQALQIMRESGFFVSIGDNAIRRKVSEWLSAKQLFPVNIIHPTAWVCDSAILASYGLLIAANAVVNPLAEIGVGVICNTGCIIEHECRIGDFSHIGPGAVLCGNVSVGKNTFIGAASVIRQGITIGDNAIIGAGAVVVKDVPDNACVKGNPARS